MNLKKNHLRRQPQQQRSQDRVEKILDIAAIVFDEIGFESATTHEIAKRANISVGSLYQFFPDKLAIFNALELRHLDRIKIMWAKLAQPEIIQLPFRDFVRSIVSQCQQLFEQPTSRIIFVQFFTSATMFKNIDHSLTQEAINFTAYLFCLRNPNLSKHRGQLLGEICTHGINTLILLALRSDRSHRQEIFREIENLLIAYLEKDLGDRVEDSNPDNLWEKWMQDYNLNHRQGLICQYLEKQEIITIQNCEAMFPEVSRRTLQRDLKIMVDRNLLIPQANTDQRHYLLNYDHL